jgi:hypothetical protein
MQEAKEVDIKKTQEPRKHHFVPKCWLAGFTETGDKNGKLWVTDMARKRQWESSPAKTGYIRDFYRLPSPQADPVVVEKTLSQIESDVAPILKSIDREQREPNEDELESLLWFMAIQWGRVPSFRPFILGVTDSIYREHVMKALVTRDSWAAYLKEVGVAADEPGADYEKMYEFVHSHQYSLSAENDWYVLQAFEAAEGIAPRLRARHWRTSFSPSGSFIASDNPVAMDGPKGQMVGFEDAEIILYPLSRHVLLQGTLVPVRPPFVNRKYIAHVNSFTMLNSDKSIFSHVPNFCWEDQERQYQTDWELFSKEKFQMAA